MADEENLNKTSSLRVYGRLLSYVRPLWLLFLISVIGHSIFAVSQAAMAHLMKIFIDALQGITDEPVWYVPMAVVVITLLRGIGSFLGEYYIAKVAQEVVHTIRCQVFNKMVEFPKITFDNTNSGHLISRITYNVTMVTEAASKSVTILVREGLTVIVLLTYLFWSNWKLTLVFLALAPVLGLIMSLVGKRMRHLSRRIQVAMGDVTHVASEAINGFKVMRAYGGETYEKERFEKASSRNRSQNLKIERTSALSTPITQFFVAAALGVVILLVIFLRNESTVGDLVAYITAVGLLPKPFKQITGVYSAIQKGLAGAETIFQHLDEPSEEDNGTQVLDRVKGDIVIRNLNFSYPGSDKKALADINLHIPPGESVAIVGKSGSGKSTLVNLIPRFYAHDEGQILIDGIDITDIKLVNLRRHMALVTQQVNLFNDTVHNNIAYGDLSNASRDEVIAAAKSAHAHEFIEQLPNGYDTLIGEDGVLLSGGQRQRLSIARAILKDAPILILDEATSALDTESERHIQAALDLLMKDRTTLVIAHRLSTIENVDRILVMENGHIVEDGTHQALLQQQKVYARLYRLQFSESASE